MNSHINSLLYPKESVYKTLFTTIVTIYMALGNRVDSGAILTSRQVE